MPNFRIPYSSFLSLLEPGRGLSPPLRIPCYAPVPTATNEFVVVVGPLTYEALVVDSAGPGKLPGLVVGVEGEEAT